MWRKAELCNSFRLTLRQLKSFLYALQTKEKKRGSDGNDEEDMSNEKMKRVMRMAKRRKDRNVEITLFNVDKTLSRKIKLQVFYKETVTN